MLKEYTFVAAMKDFFGLRPVEPGKNPNVEFLREIKALNDAERKYFADALEGTGQYKIVQVA